jgi:hypothetical protein
LADGTHVLRGQDAFAKQVGAGGQAVLNQQPGEDTNLGRSRADPNKVMEEAPATATKPLLVKGGNLELTSLPGTTCESEDVCVLGESHPSDRNGEDTTLPRARSRLGQDKLAIKAVVDDRGHRRF